MPHHHRKTSTSSSPRTTLVRSGALLAVTGALVLGSMAGVASAKGEVGSGGGGTGAPVACNPVSSLSYKGDARAGETGLSTIQINYSVKPCVAGQVVTVDTRVALSASPTTPVFEWADAPLSTKYTVAVTRNTSYTATVVVRDAETGAVVGTSSIFAAARSKGV